jgi:CubicO group peptidase (beta-lactamase class C family)
MKRLAIALTLISIITASPVAQVRKETGGTGLPTSKPEDVGMSSERLARVKVAMQRYVDQKLVPGVVTLIARRGRVIHFEAVGFRDPESQAPMTTDAIFRIASMTKPITSVAAMMLYEEGHFLLSDPISKWLPEFSDMKVAVPAPPGERVERPYKLVPAARPITIKHLLTHTAGLANAYRGMTQADYAKASARQAATETVADVVKRIAKLPLNFHPGDQWEYGPATDVVGRLVEVISGQTLDEFFRKRIFEPLGMVDTHFYMPESKVGRLTTLYQPDAENGNRMKMTEAPTKDSRWVKPPHVYFAGAGGLVSTASDYFKFHQMMLNGGELNGVRLLGRKTVELMTANHIGDLPVWITGPGFGFGLGYSVVKDIGQSAQPGSVGNYGWGGAFCTYFWVDPVEEMIGIVMTQVRPYTHLNIRQDFLVLANQAIVDTGKPKNGSVARVAGQ